MRLRAGGLIAEIEVSIHAPARGATDEAEDAFGAEFVSIHAPARGATVKSYNISI